MAVAFDANSGTPADATAVATLSLSTLTVGALANRALIGIVSLDNVATPTLSSWVWDSAGTPQNLTLINTSSHTPSAYAWMYGLVAPTSGNKTMKITFTGNVTEIQLGATASSGVDQTGGTTTFPHSISNSGTSTAPTTGPITSAVGNLTIGAVSCGASISAPTQTLIWTDNGGTNNNIAATRAAGAATVTHAWTQGSSQIWATVGTDILAFGAGGLIGYPTLPDDNDMACYMDDPDEAVAY